MLTSIPVWLNIFYAVSTSLGNVLQCSPVRYTWEKPAMDHMDANGTLVKGGTCFDSRRFILASCALSIFMDLIIIPIPSIMVWNLHSKCTCQSACESNTNLTQWSGKPRYL
jgi:hypothetical protein